MKKLLAAVLVSGLAAPAFADVNVGVIAPLTGRMASFGAQYAAAVKMFEEARARLNEREKLNFVVYDSRGDLTESISLTRKLISNDQVVAIVGPLFSSESEVSFPVAVQGKTPIISPSASKPGVAAANRPYAFGYSLTSDKKTALLVDKWIATVGKPIKNVVVILDAKDAISKFDGSVEFPNVLKKHGIQILDTIAIQTGDIDFSAAVTRAKNRNPDAVVMTVLHSEGGNLMRELRKQGMHQPVLAGVGILDPRFLELAGPAADGVMLGSDFYAGSTAPGVAKWVAEFQSKNNNMVPTAPAAMMYESLELVRSCIVSQKVSGKIPDLQADRDKIQKCLGAMKNHPVPLTGQVTINEHGEALRKPQILVVKDSRFTAVP